MAQKQQPTPETERPWEPGTAVPAYVYPYSAGWIGGVVAGMGMAVVAMVSTIIAGLGPWFPLNLVAATVLRYYQGAPDEVIAQFSYPALVVGIILHLTLSVLVGTLFVLLLPAFPGRPIVWGLVLGPALWFGAQFVVLPLINPRMSTEIWTSAFFASHLAFGLILGWWVERTPKVPAEVGGQPTVPID